MSTEKKAFDPTVSFMFFGTWVKAIEAIEKTHGPIQAYNFFKAIANYSMYDEEPDFSDNPILGAVWALTEREADLSIDKRRKQFERDEYNEQHQKIREAFTEYPDLSNRKIAELLGVSPSTVDRVRRAQKESPIFAANAYDGIHNTGTVNDSDSDNDTMTRRSDAVIDPLTCSLSLWRTLPEETRKQFTLYDRMRERIVKMDCMAIDNNSADAVRVRSKWNAFYSVWRQSITTEDVNTILEKYLATHEESPYEKKIGDKYGRFVHGWDDERQEPIIVYSPTYAGKEMKHNLDGIPLDYYRSEIDELSIEEEREAIIEFYKEHGVDMGAYEIDEDELPF